MKQKICIGIFAIAILCILLTLYFQYRPHHLTTNYKAPGTGTFDQSLNPRAPGNTALFLKILTDLSQNETEAKARTACKRLGAMGATAEGSLEILEKVAQESQHESVRVEAAKSVELIKTAISGQTASEQ